MIYYFISVVSSSMNIALDFCYILFPTFSNFLVFVFSVAFFCIWLDFHLFYNLKETPVVLFNHFANWKLLSLISIPFTSSPKCDIYRLKTAEPFKFWFSLRWNVTQKFQVLWQISTKCVYDTCISIYCQYNSFPWN